MDQQFVPHTNMEYIFGYSHNISISDMHINYAIQIKYIKY